MDRPYEVPTYVYVLKLPEDKWYVGCTRYLDERMNAHFSGRGAVATKEQHPINIDKVYVFDDYQIRSKVARSYVEVLIANRYAEKYGYEKVRGAKHGKGWSDKPSKGNFRDIDNFNKFSKTKGGVKLLSSVSELNFHYLLSEKVILKIKNANKIV